MSELIIENIHETYNYKLLKEVYFDILLPAFPDPEDHMSWEKMKKMVKKSFKNKNSNERIIICISSLPLPNGTLKPVSFFVAIYYKKSATGLISYMGVRENIKGVSASNIQKQVLVEMEKEALKEDTKIKAIFSFVDKPEYANPKYITLPPIRRIMIMEKNGASYIPIDFHYPIVEDSIFSSIRQKINYRKDAALLGYKLYDKVTTESPDAIKAFLDDFYDSYGIEGKENNILKQMKKEIDFIPKGIDIKLSKRYRLKEKEKKIKKEPTLSYTERFSHKIVNS